jgi:transcriptional regulator with XRE-family HTH domain
LLYFLYPLLSLHDVFIDFIRVVNSEILLGLNQVTDPLGRAEPEIDVEDLIVEPPHNHLGAIIRAYRKAHNVSQLKLSADVGISQTHMSDIERGLTKPSYSIVLAVWKALKVDPKSAQDLIQHLKSTERILDQLLCQAGCSEVDRPHILQLPLGTRKRLIGVMRNALRHREKISGHSHQEDPDERNEKADFPVSPPGNYLGSLIREIRRQQGLHMAELAASIGIQCSRLLAIEEGRSKPTHTQVAAIWSVLRVNFTEMEALLETRKRSDQAIEGVRRRPGVTLNELRRTGNPSRST